MLPCYKCKHRRSIPGDAHSSCVQPDVKVWYDSGLGELLRFTKQAIPECIAIGIKYFGFTKVRQHGINCGWFNWPFNYDPVWAETCNKFEDKREYNVARNN